MRVHKKRVEHGFLKKFSQRKGLKKVVSVNLSSPFVDAWYEWRLSAKMLAGAAAVGCLRKNQKLLRLTIVDELEDQYEELYEDVKNEMINYISYKAVKTVLHQLYEMNPPQYKWFHNFIAENVPNTGKGFLQTLAKENQELAERVMITRIHLYKRWIKVCDHAQMYERISVENTELMRERLVETVIWPSEDADSAVNPDGI
ncbi:hypothetical protein Leryth_002134 [Lithospermum erythrorhizon]|nr:hypothetical protein Leryth_002134 [Lithospermum erythrorhizon]